MPGFADGSIETYSFPSMLLFLWLDYAINSFKNQTKKRGSLGFAVVAGGCPKPLFGQPPATTLIPKERKRAYSVCKFI
jgi:hypothetical protein